MIGRIAMSVAVLLLAGCAKPLEVASITEISSATGSASLDVYAPQRAAGDASVPAFAGDQLVEVRTFVVKQGSGEVEVPGASCTLAAANFNANMVSPAKVRVPLYRGLSSTLAVTCEMPGYQKRMVSLSPYDITREQRLSSGTSGGLVGVLAVAAIDAVVDNSQNDWAYPPARVLLEPLPQ